MTGEHKHSANLTYWIITIIFLIWNAFGGYDYVMTRTRNSDYLRNMGDPQVLLGWINSFPLWAQICWPLGVWSSVAGSVLMLLRSRHAVGAFALSFAAALASFAYQWSASPPAALDTPANQAMPLVILALIAFLWWYCRRMTDRKVLA